MRSHLWKLMLLTLCLALPLAACSSQPAGSDDPAEFSTEITPVEATEPGKIGELADAPEVAADAAAEVEAEVAEVVEEAAEADMPMEDQVEPVAEEAEPMVAQEAETVIAQPSLQELADRIAYLETTVHFMQRTLAAVEVTASEALLNSKKNDPLSRIDLSNESDVNKAIMEKSLEQIIDISRVLLDKMESEITSGDEAGVKEPAAEAVEEAPAAGEAATEE